MNPRLLLLPIAFHATLCQSAQEEKIEIGVVHAQLRYDKTSFQVKPGTKVTLTFANTDELAHNLIVCKGGEEAWKTVADAALKLGASGEEKGWLPESDLILAATKMLKPHAEESITFDVPDTEGIYPYVCTFPGHSLLMRGQMVVSNFPRGLGDLRFRYYEGNWDKLPDFSQLTPAETGKIEENKISLAPRKRDENFAFVFEGDLQAPLDGDYAFSTLSDDGSRLLIDGKTVVDNDGAHSPQQRSGKIHLTQGPHRLEVQYFEVSGGEELAVAWSGPGFKMEPLSAGGTLTYVDPTEFQPAVAGVAKVIRVLMPDASPRSMAVGLPGGVNFCFDAGTCSVRYAWDGGFVDVAPDRGNGTGRGGGVCNPLGEIWKVGDAGAPAIRFAENDPAPRFGGYRIDGETVEFHYLVGDRAIQQRIKAAPGGNGLTYSADAGKGSPPPQLHLKFDEIEISDRTGDSSNLLTLTVRPKK